METSINIYRIRYLKDTSLKIAYMQGESQEKVTKEFLKSFTDIQAEKIISVVNIQESKKEYDISKIIKIAASIFITLIVVYGIYLGWNSYNQMSNNENEKHIYSSYTKKETINTFSSNKRSDPKFERMKDLINTNSYFASAKKDQHSIQPLASVSNKLTNLERQELEQLRAEKAKVAREKEANSIDVSNSKFKLEIYYARISQRDHYGAKNKKLKDAGTILQQDRANYHKYNRRDREDTGDNHFDTRGNRNKIKRMLARGSTSKNILDAIRYGTPLVKVKIYPEYIDVTLESGGSQTQQRQQKKNSAPPRQNKSKKSKCNTDGSIRGISSRGDGFVAVRKGPGTKHRMVGKIYRNGTRVKICDRKGKWKGIIYGDCIAGSSRSRNGSCKAGWVYEKYIRIR